jgi:ankyrin repeat protein
MLACRHSDITTLELILNQSEGSNILEERDNEQQTPLFVATVSGNVKCLEALLKVKANPNVYNKGNDTHSFGFQPTFADGITPLMYACGRGMVHAVKLLLAHKADPNAKSRASKMTALHFACHFGISTQLFAKLTLPFRKCGVCGVTH